MRRVGKGATRNAGRNESSGVAPCPRVGREREHGPNAWARRAQSTEIMARSGPARPIAREDGRKTPLWPTLQRIYLIERSFSAGRHAARSEHRQGRALA